MKLGCDVCLTASASVICCSDEAALCARCDEEIHAANKLAGKHRRLSLNCSVSKLPRCDICQDKVAFILCVEDRALFCEDCDEAIHAINTVLANHQRLLATNIRLGLSSTQSMDSINCHYDSSRGNSMPQSSIYFSKEQIPSGSTSPTWAFTNQLYDSELGYKDASIGYGELSCYTPISVSEQASESSHNHAKVPELLSIQSSYDETFFRPPKSSMSSKKPRIGIMEDLDFFIVPKLG